MNSRSKPKPINWAGSLPLYLLFVALFSPSLSGQIIPANRLVPWTSGIYTGVPGGIPTNRTNLIDVTKAPYNADNTGVSNAAPAIQLAINAANSNDVVYLPAGTYRASNSITLGYTKKGITLRGAGSNTVIKSYTDRVISLGNGTSFNWPSGGSLIKAGLAKGSTNITIADTSFFSVGDLAQIFFSTDTNIPIINVYGETGNEQQQKVRVTAKTPTTLAFWPPLYEDYSSLTCRIGTAQNVHPDFVGVEDLLIDASNAPAGFSILFNQCYASWLKNVTVRLSPSIHIYCSDLLNCEIRDCFLDRLSGAGTSHAGIILYTSSGCLVENNIIYQAGPGVECNNGDSGNVFGYNLFYNPDGAYAIDSNHGPHNDFNLFEGNIINNFIADGYFGSVSHDTLFRNWIHGQSTNGNGSSVGWCVSLKRFTRNYNIVGNIVGTGLPWTMSGDGMDFGAPNLVSGSFTGYGPPWSITWSNGAGVLSKSGNSVTVTQPMFTPATVFDQANITISNGIILDWKTWAVMAPLNSTGTRRFNITPDYITNGYVSPTHVLVDESATSYTNVAYLLSPGPGGYQEWDTNVLATLIRKGNFNYSSNAIPAGEALGTNTLVTSYYLTSKPAWFGNLAWPPFDPTNPNPTFDSVPAGYRYVHGTNPPVGQPPLPPANLRVLDQ
jgi:hypothetical protein